MVYFFQIEKNAKKNMFTPPSPHSSGACTQGGGLQSRSLPASLLEVAVVQQLGGGEAETALRGLADPLLEVRPEAALRVRHPEGLQQLLFELVQGVPPPLLRHRHQPAALLLVHHLPTARVCGAGGEESTHPQGRGPPSKGLGPAFGHHSFTKIGLV